MSATVSARAIYRRAAIYWLTASLCLLVLNVLAAGVLFLWDPGADVEEPPYVEEALQRIYPDWSEEDRRALRDENRRDFQPEAMVQFREKQQTGRFSTVDGHGFRHGLQQGPWPPESSFFNIFVLGGSTAFGYGVPDEDTIPSQVQRLLGRVDLARPPRVYNFGRGTFYSTMERILFDKLMTLGPKPDLVVFLDGLNEFYWPEDPPPLTVHWTKRVQETLAHPFRAAIGSLPIMRLIEAWRSRGAIEIFGREIWADQPSAVLRRESDRVLERYLGNKAAIEARAAAATVPVAMVWQPVPTYGYDLRHHVVDGNFGPHELTRTGYPRMHERLQKDPVGENFFWCAEIQRGLTELLYVDKVHYSPAMSARVAQCIVDNLVERGLVPLHQTPSESDATH
jgi:hypothetical protein